MRDDIEYLKKMMNEVNARQTEERSQKSNQPYPTSTHCAELVFQIITQVSDLELVETSYSVDGTRTIVKDKYDGQEYIMTLQPKRD